MNCFTYMMANARNGTLYVGVTSDLVRRVWLHKNHGVPGFTSKYTVNRLVWFESTSDIQAAISREKQLKNWRREWKIVLIEKMNPYWRDLYDEVLGMEPVMAVAVNTKTLDCGSNPQ